MTDDDTETTPLERLARFTLAHQHGDRVTAHDAIEQLLVALRLHVDTSVELFASMRESHRSMGLPLAEDVTGADAVAGLALVREQRDDLDGCERAFIEAYMDRGGTWTAAASALGTTAGALRQRYRRLGGTRTWAPGRPRTTVTAPTPNATRTTTGSPRRPEFRPRRSRTSGASDR